MVRGELRSLAGVIIAPGVIGMLGVGNRGFFSVDSFKIKSAVFNDGVINCDIIVLMHGVFGINASISTLNGVFHIFIVFIFIAAIRCAGFKVCTDLSVNMAEQDGWVANSIGFDADGIVDDDETLSAGLAFVVSIWSGTVRHTSRMLNRFCAPSRSTLVVTLLFEDSTSIAGTVNAVLVLGTASVGLVIAWATGADATV